MLRWFALAALVALAVAGGVSAADAQRLSTTDISGDFPDHGGFGGTVTGIWSDGTHIFVLEDIAETTGNTGRILTYHMNLTLDRHSGKNFTHLAGHDQSDNSKKNRSPDGIWSDGTTMWVGDSIINNGKVFAYNMATKAHDSAKDFNIGNPSPQIRGPAGMWGDGTTLWISDYPDGIYAFDISNPPPISYKNQNISAATLDATGNDVSWGIWSDGTIMWVLDNNDSYVYAYRLSDKSREPSREFKVVNSTDQPLTNAHGIWSDGKTMWVVEGKANKEKIHTYRLPPAPTAAVPRTFVYVPPPDTTPPTVKSVERTGNATTTNHTLTWDVRFSESVRVGLDDVHTSYTSVANATIPDLGMVSDTLLADVPGAVTGGSVSVDLQHPITSGLLIELVAPDCTRFVVHNQTTTFPYKLRQPHDLGDLSGVGAAGQWTLHVYDRAKYWNGTLNGWTLELESRGVVEGSGRTHTITQYVAGPGNYTLSLDGFDIRDRAGNRLADTDPAVNEPYLVVGAVARTCQE